MNEAKNHSEYELKLHGIKEKLLERKKELEEQLEDLYHQKKTATGDVKDSGDEAQSSILETLNISLQDAELGEYNMILQALRKINEGAYGICIDCGQPISEKRLVSYPNASRCLSCQEILEEKGGLL